MKYYIPVSSLNLNSILSTESLSPQTFYATRRFGTSHWFAIPEQPLQDAVLLYAEPHQFMRPVSDIEDHPMLLEVELYEELPMVREGVFMTDRTVYLNPTNTHIIFFDEQHKNTALSLLQNSNESKVVRMYRNRMVVATFSGEYPYVEEFSNPQKNSDAEAEDVRINRLKGLLYGYFIGARLSMSKECVSQVKALESIKNIASAIMSNSPDVMNDDQQIRLAESLAVLEEGTQDFLGLKEQIKEESKGVDDVIALIRKVFKFNASKGWCEDRYDADYFVSLLAGGTLSGWMSQEEQRVKNLIQSGRRLLSPDCAEVIVGDDGLPDVSESALSSELDRRLFTAWVKLIISHREFTGKISTIKKDLTEELTLCAKELYGDGWASSRVREFMNHLRRHIRGESFEEPWGNGLLSSIAAVILKGDDWETLLRFLQSKEMTEYKLAFAFYGLLNGFANLTRDFTENLIRLDSEYLKAFYQEIHGQLHRQTLVWPQVSIVDEFTTSNSADADGNAKVMAGASLRTRILKFFESDAYKYKGLSKNAKESLRHGLLMALERLGPSEDPVTFVAILNDFEGDGWKKSLKPWKLMQTEFAPSYDSQVAGTPKKKSARRAKRLADSDSAGPLFDHAATLVDTNQQRRLLIEDPELLDILMQFFENAKLEVSAELLHKDVAWIQRGYAVNGKYAQDPSGNPRDNLSTARHFVNLLAVNGRIDDDCKEPLKDYLKKYYK